MKPLSNPQKQSMNILVMFIILLCTQRTAQCQVAANFSANLVSGCSPILVNFTDQSSGNPTEWKWDLGNGTYSNLQNPSVTYFAPGFYSIKLVIKKGTTKDSVIKTNFIQVFPTAVVKFNASPTVGCNPFPVSFTDQTVSAASISTWQWDFGDGILSGEQHPTHTYTLPGDYAVTLKVITANGCASTLRKSAYINNNVVKAAFINWPVAACTPNKIGFQNNSTANSTYTSHWDYGDGTSSSLLGPAHTYTTGGTYIVKLTVQNQAGCIDTFSKAIKVESPVSAAFSGDHLFNCKAPATVNFSNQVSADNSYLWYFGDSSTSTQSNPSHTYTDTGVFSVRLIVTNSSGCIDSSTKTKYIKVQSPVIVFNNLPDSGCIPFTKTFSVTNVSSVGISSYLWNFNDGDNFTSTLPSPVHTFQNLGSYTISLITTAVNGCKDTSIVPDAIRLSTKPVANFSVNPRNACASTIINFTDLSTGGANSWLWTFGDNNFSPEQNPLHIYKDTGWMDVQLTALNGGCANTITFEKYIYIKPAVAKFSIDFQCQDKLKRSFNNFSIGADHLNWSFGDGSSSSDSSPIHYYPGPGIYNVTLTATNDSTHCDYSVTKRVKIIDLYNNFFASDSSVCKGVSTRLSTGIPNPDVLKYFWNFGDDTTTITRVNYIAHTYSNRGTYTVKLTTLDSLNCMDSVIKRMYINVVGPTASFAVMNGGGCINALLLFSDSTVAETNAPIRRWEWNFGDGTRDSVSTAPFVHTYLRNGSYPVSLKVTDSRSCTDTFQLPAKVVIKKPSAWFFANDSVACPGYNIKFVCPYAETGTTYDWHFGDGTNGTGQSPQHAYQNEGVYTVTLIIRNRYGCQDTSTVTNMIRVKKTVAVFDMSDSFRTCPPLLIQFSNHSTGMVSEYWKFGDSSSTNAADPSHFYTYPGVYTATLIAKGHGACADTVSKRIIVKGPKGSISYSPLALCKPYQVDFIAHTENAVSYIWDFNDGVTALGADTSLRYVYQDSGIFLPKIILVDDIGCRVAVTGKDSITNVYAKPFFKFPDSVLCNGGSISFQNSSSSNDAITSYRWTFGDSNSTTATSPVHQYPLPGIYYPSLSITTARGCTGNYQSPVPVRVALSPAIEMLTSGDGCAPLNANFHAAITSADTGLVNWQWQLGNSNTSLLKDPPVQQYTNPGVYTITLTANVSNGCSKTIVKTIEAFAAPVVKITGSNFLCRGVAANLMASGASSYKWLSAGGLTCDSCASVTVRPMASAKFSVTGTSLQGCSSKDSISIQVKQPFVMTYSTPVSMCKGQSSRLAASGAATYDWFPSQGLNSSTVASPLAKPDTTTNYRVVGTDDAGCFKDTGFVKLTVYNSPTVNAGPDKTISAGTSIDLEAAYSSDVTEVKWSPTGDIFRAGSNIITVKPVQNTEYNIEVKNPGGCYANDRVNVIVKFDGANVFIPNLFSPNNDGINDVFYPRGKGISKIRKMAIFSRWGELVFEKTNFNSNDPSAGWDGTFRGGKLGTDVFVYVVELIGENGTILPLSGNVSLSR